MRKMGLAVAIFFGVILLTSTVMISLPGLMAPLEDPPGMDATGTPADNYPVEQRDQFCGTGEAKSTAYVREYKIPTDCTNPLAIVTDYDGTVWFVQSNTGNVSKFDPLTESFTEFENPSWPDGGRSVMWGMDYAPDGSLWFTDDFFDAVWKFSPFDGSYGLVEYPAGEGGAMPQKISVLGSDIVFNDFIGGKMVILTPLENDANMLMIPPIINGSVASDFDTDAEKNIWFTSWVFPQSGLLAKFDYGGYSETPGGSDLQEFMSLFPLPEDATTINGVAVHDDGNVWLADTSSSFFFAFDPATSRFTKFVTSNPDVSTYGNATGVVKSPVTRPYWIDTDGAGNIVFTEQTANRIGVFDPSQERLVEYLVPSKNPNWADCGDMEDCGVAQVFDFAIHGEKIWFTEWVENNIGVVDTSVALPFDVDLGTGIVAVSPGSPTITTFTVTPNGGQELPGMSPFAASSEYFLGVGTELPEAFQDGHDGARTITAMVAATEDAVPGQYKVLLGAQTDEVSVGKFLTVVVGP